MSANKYNTSNIRGTIYEIKDNTNGNVYIGSTTQSLKYRMRQHVYNTIRNNTKDKKDNTRASTIINNGNYSSRELEYAEFDNVESMRIREKYWINNTPNCINKNNPIRTKDEWNGDKYMCECGRVVRLYCFKGHLNTDIHKKYMDFPFSKIECF